MTRSERQLASSILIAMIVLSAIVGRSIPAFYRWTGSNQSTPASLLWQVPLGIAVTTMLLCISLYWIPMPSWRSESSHPGKQFSLRAIFISMTTIAVLLGIGAAFSSNLGGVISAVLLCLSVVAAIRSAVIHPEWRLPIAAIFGCMYLPMNWVLTHRVDLSFEFLGVIAGQPSFLTKILCASLIGENLHSANWLAIVFTTVQIWIGLWLITRGPKSLIPYLAFVAVLSAMGSLVIHMLVLA